MTPDSFDRGPNSGPLYRDTQGAPPILAEYPDEPQYDLTTIVHLVGVRPRTLWSWEQQLGIPQPEHGGDGTVRHYSERDLVACIWIRDQLLLGSSATHAAALLLRAQPPNAGPASPASPMPLPLAPVPGVVAPPTQTLPEIPDFLLSGQQAEVLPAGDAASSPPGAASRADQTPPLVAPRPSQPQLPPPPFAPAWDARQQTGASGPPRPIPPPLRPPVFSGPLHSGPPSMPPRPPVNAVPLRAPSPSGPLRGLAYPPTATSASGTNWPQLPGVTVGPPSGPLRAATPSGPLRATPSGAISQSRWPMPSPSAGREMRGMAQQLVRAFATFDTYSANRLVDEALSQHTIEVTCVGLLLPALARVAELSAHRQMSNPEQGFAINFVRGRLFTVFQSTPERPDAPDALVTCAPREMDDIGALALATFWRRAGLRVVFLGQDTDGADLVHEARKRRPRLICVCASTPQRVRALSRIARGISQLDARPPLFTYSGAPFARNPELQQRVMGVYLGDDPATATWHALRLLGIDRRNSPPPTLPGPTGVGQAG